MVDDDTEATSAARAFIAYVAMKETQSYIQRGRRFAGATVDALNELYAAGFNALAQGDRTLMQDMEDAGSELGLRNLVCPYEMVREAMSTLRRRRKEALASNPSLLVDAMGDTVDAFLAEYKKPVN